MNKIVGILMVLILLTIGGCKHNETHKNNIKNSTEVMNTKNQLKDGIDLATSFINTLEFNKYKYNNQFIEQIEVSAFDDPSFRERFFKFLESRDFDQNQFEQIFFIKLLLVRIQQVPDIRSYYIISSIFNNQRLAYFLEDYELYLFQLFLYKPEFFINGEYKYKESQINEYINQNLPTAFLTDVTYFENNIVDINLEDDALLIGDEIVDSFTIPQLQNEIKHNCAKIEANFSPSLDTSWQSKTTVYYNILNFTDNNLAKRLDKSQVLLYDTKYKPFFSSYIITRVEEKSVVDDPDGYTNLRKEKNSTSEILQKVKSGENIKVLENNGDWFLVQTKEGKEGYIHKSRIKSY